MRHLTDGHPMLQRYLNVIPRCDILLPSVVVAESLRKRCEFATKAEPDQVLLAHSLLLELLQLVQTFQHIGFDAASAERFRQLKLKHPQHKLHADLMIAAIAQTGKHIVVTRNLKDFSKFLPPHQLQNWIDDPPSH